jgi:superfamily II DNA or RNA helicase
VSGTPDWDGKSLPLMEATLGPLFHKTDESELVHAGLLLKPEVHVHDTAFTYPYVPTHDHLKGTDCKVPGCSGGRQAKLHRNNYSGMLSELVDETTRNAQIARTVVDELRDGRTVLVVSGRLKHLDNLRDAVAVETTYPTLMLTGAESSEERMEVGRRAMQGGVAIFSTIADEALDIPRLDSIHLVWPTANPRKVEQQAGRVLRTHGKKMQPRVHDYRDAVGVLRKQFQKRLELYRNKGWAVKGAGAEGIFSRPAKVK